MFVWDAQGNRVFHAADPTLEGKSGAGAQDVLGRPYGQWFLDVLNGSSGEGWVHYMYPEPGRLFPAWKSTFLKRARLATGQTYLVGAGVYHMQMDPTLITDLVNQAAALVSAQGPAAFNALRDPKGPFRFMDSYVFVDTWDGVELVNPAQVTLEGKNLSVLTDIRGKKVTREIVSLVKQRDKGWIDYWWNRPGENKPAKKRAYVRRARFGDSDYIVGSGIYFDWALPHLCASA